MDRQRAIETIQKLRMRTQSRGAEPAEEEQATTLANLLERKYAITKDEAKAKPRESIEEVLDGFAKEQWNRFVQLEAEILKPGFPWQLDYEQLLRMQGEAGCFGLENRELRISGLDRQEFLERKVNVSDAILKAMKPLLAQLRLQRKAEEEKRKQERAARKARKRQSQVLFDF